MTASHSRQCRSSSSTVWERETIQLKRLATCYSNCPWSVPLGVSHILSLDESRQVEDQLENDTRAKPLHKPLRHVDELKGEYDMFASVWQCSSITGGWHKKTGAATQPKHRGGWGRQHWGMCCTQSFVFRLACTIMHYTINSIVQNLFYS